MTYVRHNLTIDPPNGGLNSATVVVKEPDQRGFLRLGVAERATSSRFNWVDLTPVEARVLAGMLRKIARRVEQRP
jgi:hypothetical protein